MKTKQIWAVIVTIAMLTTSCAIEKRNYNKGYSIDMGFMKRNKASETIKESNIKAPAFAKVENTDSLLLLTTLNVGLKTEESPWCLLEQNTNKGLVLSNSSKKSIIKEDQRKAQNTGWIINNTEEKGSIQSDLISKEAGEMSSQKNRGSRKVEGFSIFGWLIGVVLIAISVFFDSEVLILLSIILVLVLVVYGLSKVMKNPKDYKGKFFSYFFGFLTALLALLLIFVTIAWWGV